MKLKMYWDYLMYILEHKKNVFIECWKEGLYLHAFTHDLSKFSKYEFVPYAEWFYGYNGIKLKEKYNEEQLTNGMSCISSNYLACKDNFQTAWVHHYVNNPHHWNYYCHGCRNNPVFMPEKYIKQMICDWKAMSRKFGNSVHEYYYKNIDNIILHNRSRVYLEYMLGFIDSGCLLSEVSWKDYCEMNGISLEEDFNSLFGDK